MLVANITGMILKKIFGMQAAALVGQQLFCQFQLQVP